jgi:hypothetical protein
MHQGAKSGCMPPCSTKGWAAMKTKTCPMCQGEQFFTSTFVPTENFLLAAFKNVGVFASVCLSCGFVAPTVDNVGLDTIRKMARTRANDIHGKATGPDLGTL